MMCLTENSKNMGFCQILMIKRGQDVKNSFKIRFSAKFWCGKHSQTSSRAHLVNLMSTAQNSGDLT